MINSSFTIELAIIVLGLFGFLLASYIHNKKIGNTKLVCPLRSDCDTVINSDYSKVLGIPVEVLGMFYYAFISIAYGMQHLYSLPIIFPKILMYISILATVFSIYLICIQAFKIKEWCMWCMGSAFVSFLICILSFYKNFILV